MLDGCVNHAIGLFAFVGMSQQNPNRPEAGEAAHDPEQGANVSGAQTQGSFVPEVANLPEEDAYIQIEQDAKKPWFRVPAMGWVVFGGLLACILAIILMSVFKPPSLEQEAEEVEMVIQASKKEDEKEAEQKSVRQIFEELTACVSGYYSSSHIEAKLQYVRHPERVSILMEHYYKNHPMVTGEFAQFEKYSALDLEGVPFVYARVQLNNGKSENVLLEQMGDGSFKLDWESNVHYLPMSWPDYIHQRPTRPMTMRVMVAPDNFYVYEFRDNQKYDCYKLTAINSDDYIFGYVEKGSVASIQLRQFFMRVRQVAGVKPEPMTLLIRFPENSKSRNCVHIDRLMALRWVFVHESDADPGSGGY